MHILLLGSGGREHALAWKIAASPLLTKLWCAPGNAGIAKEAECVALDITDHPAVIDFCKAHKVDFVVVGPDAPIAAGMVDDLFLTIAPKLAGGDAPRIVEGDLPGIAELKLAWLLEQDGELFTRYRRR